MRNPLFFLAFFATCFASSDSEKVTSIQIKTTPSTNQGLPFYALIKSVDFPRFLTDDYSKVAHQRMLSKESPETLEVVFFVPGQTKTIEVKNPKATPVAVYFILTRPGEDWKFIASDESIRNVKILLGENQIHSVSMF